MAVVSGFSEEDTARVSLIAVEAATNILRHGNTGAMLLNTAPDGRPKAVLIAAVDHGPGIGNLDRALEDGASSTGGMGGGLGAIKRMSDALDIYSHAGQGTVLTAMVGGGDISDYENCCGVLIPKPGYSACGDGWVARQAGTECWAMLCDGLGHGDKASAAADAAVEAFQRAPLDGPDGMLDVVDRALARERGAAALIVRVAPEEGFAEASGVGNVAGAIVQPGGQAQRLVSQGGVAGGGVRAPKPVRYSWDDNSTLILATDGLRTIHDFGTWPGLMQRAPLTIAATILRDLNRRSDDSGVLVMRDCA